MDRRNILDRTAAEIPCNLRYYSCIRAYRIFSNLIRAIFTVLEG